MIVVFAGPTIEASAVQKALPAAEVRPPARTGDIFAACKQQASAIGLIDGFFEGVPSVWHKEILWALDQGISVYGASSMGALRAAELHPFGMVGVGRIFEAFRDGQMEDDDEVALRHGPQELGYVALSETMVNIRASLDRAVATGIVAPAFASDLTSLAKNTYFPERSWERVFEQAARQDMDAGMLEKLRNWLPAGRVDQKQLDALEMLSVMSRRKDDEATTTKPFKFQHTVMWEELTRMHDTQVPNLETRLIFDQIRRDPDRYQELRHRAAADLVSDKGMQSVPQREINRALTQFRTQERLFTGASLEAWLTANGLDQEALLQRFREDLARTFAIAENRSAFRDAVLMELKAEGSYDPVQAEARQMAERLERAGYPDPGPEDLGVAPGKLTLWFFEELKGMSIPEDLETFWRQQDFADQNEFEQMMAREFVLWQDQG